MNDRDFCYWLRGFMEMNPELESINKEQIEMIKKHLDLVFNQKQELPYYQQPWYVQTPQPNYFDVTNVPGVVMSNVPRTCGTPFTLSHIENSQEPYQSVDLNFPMGT